MFSGVATTILRAARSFQSLWSTNDSPELQELQCSTPPQASVSTESIFISSPQFSLEQLPYPPSNDLNHQLLATLSSYQLATGPITVRNYLSCLNLACNINREHLYFGNHPKPEPEYPLLAIWRFQQYESPFSEWNCWTLVRRLTHSFQHNQPYFLLDYGVVKPHYISFHGNGRRNWEIFYGINLEQKETKISLVVLKEWAWEPEEKVTKWSIPFIADCFSCF